MSSSIVNPFDVNPVATAPKTGRHMKKSSIEAFDPLWKGGEGSGQSPQQQQPEGTSSAADILLSLAPSLEISSQSATTAAGSGTKTPTQQQQQQQRPHLGSVSPKELARELREIATEIEKTTLTSSPGAGGGGGASAGGADAKGTRTPSRRVRRLSLFKKKKSSKGLDGAGGSNHNRAASTASAADLMAATSTTPTATMTPGRYSNKRIMTTPGSGDSNCEPPPDLFDLALKLNSAPAAMTTAASAAGARGRTSSADAFTAASSNNNTNNAPASLTSPMMQELWYTSPASAMQDLTIPSLSKPRPTSFLTGKEVVRTSEQDATNWQVSIPKRNDFEVCAKLSQFLDLNAFQPDECPLDLSSLIGMSVTDMKGFASGETTSLIEHKIADCQRPAVESLLESAGNDLVQVRGHYLSGGAAGNGVNPTNRREFLIVERQQQLLVIFRGTKSEQHGKFAKQSETTQLKENDKVEVFVDYVQALAELEPLVITLLDQLTEELPFCDIAFAGHSFGAAMATLAAYRYAFARPELRVQALVTSCPKIGMESLRLSAHSLPNLKLMRVELENTRIHATSASGCDIGHIIRINTSASSPSRSRTSSTNNATSGNNTGNNTTNAGPGTVAGANNKDNAPVKAFRFGEGYSEESKQASVRSILFKRERGLTDYVMAFESLDDTKWLDHYYKEDCYKQVCC